MSSQQQKAAAADMLTAARNEGDFGQGLPSDALIRTFWSDLTDGCSPIGSMSLVQVGVGVYLVGRSTYAP